MAAKPGRFLPSRPFRSERNRLCEVRKIDDALPFGLRPQRVLDRAVERRRPGGRRAALPVGHECVALLHQGCEFLIRAFARLRLLVDLGLALLGCELAQRVRQFVVLDACDCGAARRHGADQIAVAGHRFG